MVKWEKERKAKSTKWLTKSSSSRQIDQFTSYTIYESQTKYQTQVKTSFVSWFSLHTQTTHTDDLMMTMTTGHGRAIIIMTCM